MKTEEEIEKRITLEYLREHNYNTGLTPEEFLTLIDDPDIKYELEEWFECCENLNVPTTSNDGMVYDPEFAELLHKSAQKWRYENTEEAAKYDDWLNNYFRMLKR